MVRSTARMRACVDPSPFSGPQAVRMDVFRNDWIAAKAFQLAAQRGFEPGHELDDWLAAEREYAEIFF